MSFEELEKARIAYKDKLLSRLKIIGIIVAVAYVVIYAVPLGLTLLSAKVSPVEKLVEVVTSLVVVGALLLAAFGLIVLLARGKESEYRKAYKAYFVSGVLQKFFTEINYQHDRGMPLTVLSGTGMIDTGDVYSSNDFVSAKYGNVAFMQADVKIQRMNTDEDGNTTYTTIFKGRWMTFEFARKFDFGLEVAGRRFSAKKVPRGQRKFRRMELESREFNQLYKVYAQDGFEAFYLLEPSLMASLCKLGEKYKRKVLLCFVDKQLHIAIDDGKDAWEPPRPWREIDEGKEWEKVTGEMRMVTDIVDELKLDR